LLKDVFRWLSLVFESEEYVHLEQDLTKGSSVTYQKRNYNPRTPLLLDGLTAHGFTVDNSDLKFVIATDKNNNELLVLTLSLRSTTRYS